MYEYVLVVLLILLMFVVLDILFFSTTTSLDEHLFHRNYYNRIDFPVNSFIKITPSYTKKVETGKQVAKTKTMVICCLARNVAHVLPLAKLKLERIGDQFKDYRVVIFENDSSDSTRSDLIEWKRENHRIHIIECNTDPDETLDCKLNERSLYDVGCLSQERMHKMSRFRNMYLNYVKKNLIDFDFMMVYDIDISGPVHVDGLLTSFASPNEWDVMCANGLSPIPGTCGLMYQYYDEVSLINPDENYEGLKHATMIDLITRYIDRVFDRRYSGEELIPLKSAFGGYTIYKIPSMLHDDVLYLPEYKCEHIYLHKKLADHGYGRLFINPYAMILVGRQGPNGYNLIFNQ
jgi:hypothetical protein